MFHDNLGMNIMTPAHPRWREFADRLGGPEGCNFRSVKGKFMFDCDGEPARPKANALLRDYNVDITATLAYFEENGGFCDCEILFNVDPLAQS